MTTTIDLDSFVAEAMAAHMTAPEPVKATTTIITEEPVAVAAEPAPVVEIKLGKGETAFSTIFGAVPKNMLDFGIPSYKAHEAVAYHIPKADEDYVVQTEEAARLVAGIVDGDKILMTGPTGSGKSSLCKYVCSKLHLPFIRVNMSGDMESSALFGQLVVRDGATVWEDGPLTEAVRYGAVVLIDEWELMPPEISMGLQNLLEDGGYLFLKEMPGKAEDKTLVPHENFRIICAGNTVGQGDDTGGFSGTMVQNSATVDRFTTTIKLDYLSIEHEVAVIQKKTGVRKDVATKMRKVADLVRTAYSQCQVNLTMSPRTLINWGNKYKKYGNMEFAFAVAFLDKLRDSDKRAVKELYGKVF